MPKLEEEKLRERRIVAEVRKKIQQGLSVAEEYHKRANINGNFVSALGNQWNKEDVKAMKAMKAPALTLRFIHLALAALSGREIIDRLEPKIQGFGPGDEGWAERLNYVCKWDRKGTQSGPGASKLDAARAESSAFWQVINSGVGAVRTKTNDMLWIPRTSWEDLSIFDLVWDPNSEGINFHDRNWHAVRLSLSEDEFVNAYPEYRDKVKTLMASSSYGSMGSGIEEAHSRPFIYDKTGMELDRKKENNIDVVYYERRDPIESVIVDTESGGFEEISEKQFISKYITEEGINPSVVWRPGIMEQKRYALIAGDVFLEGGRLKENDWTVHFITGFKSVIRSKIRYFGITDLSIDLQQLINKFFSLWIFGLATSGKNTFLTEPDTFDNQAEAEAVIARGGLLTANNLDGVKQFPRGDMPDFQGGVPMLQKLMSDMWGMDPYSLGSAGSTGSLSRTSSKSLAHVQESGLALVSQPFDNYAKYKEDVTYTQIRKIIAYLSPKQIQSIISNETTFPSDVLNPMMKGQQEFEVPPKSEWKAVLEKDVVIDHVPSSPSEKMAFWQTLTQMPDMLSRILDIAPDLIVDVLPPNVPASFKKKLEIRFIQQQQQQQEQEQAMAAEAEEELQPETEVA